MGFRTRIGLGCLAGHGRGGSVELPEEANEAMCCPQCGSLVRDGSQCFVMFIEWPNEQDINVVRMVVDCRGCGCVSKEPMMCRTWQFLRDQGKI